MNVEGTKTLTYACGCRCLIFQLFSVDLQTVVGTLLFPSDFAPGWVRQLCAVDLIKLPSVQCLSRQNTKNLCGQALIFIKEDSHIPCQNFNELCKMKILKWSF